MKNIKSYNIRRNPFHSILKKTFLFSAISISFFSVFGNLGLNTQQFLTDIIGISKSDLYEKAEKLTFDGTIWPLKQITDLSSSSIQKSSLKYGELRGKFWNEVPSTLKVTFPKKVYDYTQKYQNITLARAWDVFKNPQQLDEFTFLRRIIRTTRAASYNSEKIWIRGSGTHAGVDIIGNTGTPLNSIANGLVIRKVYSGKGFGNYFGILHKIDGKYYVSFYAHMEDLAGNLNVGDFVKKGDYIGTIGNTGNSFGAHLHFQINKITTLDDIINGNLMNGWFHDTQGVYDYTLDPLPFVEKYYNNSIGDDFPNNSQNIASNNALQDNNDLPSIENVDEPKPVVDNHTSAPVLAKIKSIDIDLIDDKVQLGYAFIATIRVQPGEGTIGITTSNDNLTVSQNIIEDPKESEYKISFKARNLGETKIQFNDGDFSKTYDLRIYKPTTEKVYGIKVDVSKLNIIADTKITIYPINRFGQILDSKINGTYKIYFQQNGKNTLLKTVLVNGIKYEGYIKGNEIGEGKLIVESADFYAKQNISIDIAEDYSYNSKYSNDIYKLIKNGIVKGDSGRLYPNRNLTRRELLTVLGRSILRLDYDSTKIKMQNHIKQNGKFFKDINGKYYSDPYVFAAWEMGIVKGENSYSLSNTNVSKGELLTILMRLFKINTKEDLLHKWNDLPNGSSLKIIADTAKKYGLYPSDNYSNFDAGKLVSRVIAFETLQRFINYKGSGSHISSTNQSNTSSQDENLESTFSDIFDF